MYQARSCSRFLKFLLSMGVVNTASLKSLRFLPFSAFYPLFAVAGFYLRRETLSHGP
jgi:hypothetical protein